MEKFTSEIESLLAERGIPFQTACVPCGESGIDVVTAFPEGRHPVNFIPSVPDATDLDTARSAALSLESVLAQLTGGETMTVAFDLWRSRRELMAARILAHCGVFAPVYARNCEVRRIERPQAEAFLSANHTYGGAKMRYCYGMFLRRHTGTHCTDAGLPLPGEMVAVAAFSNARRWNKGGKIVSSYEWVRYASLAGVRVCGGMGKMLKVFVNDVNPDDIMTYADLEWSSGQTYLELGFQPEGKKEPVDFSIDTCTWHRTALNRLERGGLPSAITSSAMTSSAITSGTVFYRNRGSLKYRLKLSDY